MADPWGAYYKRVSGGRRFLLREKKTGRRLVLSSRFTVLS